MALSEGQKEILYLYEGDFDKELTIDYIFNNIDGHYFSRKSHLSPRLTALVKQNLLIRVKRGVYKLGRGTKNKPSTINKNQLNLF